MKQSFGIKRLNYKNNMKQASNYFPPACQYITHLLFNTAIMDRNTKFVIFNHGSTDSLRLLDQPCRNLHNKRCNPINTNQQQ